MRNIEYIILFGDVEERLCILNDLKKDEERNIKFHFAKKRNIKGNLLKVIRKIHLSKKINKFLNMPNKIIWYDLKNLKISNEKEYYIIIFCDVFWTYNHNVVNQFFNKPNCHLIFVILDSINVKGPIKIIQNLALKKIKFDYVFSYDKEDAIKYNFQYLNEHYYSSMDDFIDKSKNIEYDIYFCGRLKPGREQMIMDCYKMLDEQKLRAKFDICLRTDDLNRWNDDKKNLEEGINYFKEEKSYQELINEANKSNCILELIQTGQNAPTLRYFEAVTLNKKLLTNNPNIINCKYYNPKYMKIIHNLSDINYEWIKQKEDINYNYKGDFSIEHLLEDIEKLYKNSKT